MGILRPYEFYPKHFIERQANRLLHQMEATPFAPVWPFDAASVADFLDLGVVWEVIPPDQGGAIAARILPTQRMIEINEAILQLKLDPGFIESTLAHEVGHWILHIDQDAVEAETCDEAEEPFVCRGTTDETKVASMEWQAQYFASCLLMPRWVLDQKFSNRSFTNWSHLYEVKTELGVTISNLLHRLRDLGWVSRDQKTRKLGQGQLRANRSS